MENITRAHAHLVVARDAMRCATEELEIAEHPASALTGMMTLQLGHLTDALSQEDDTTDALSQEDDTTDALSLEESK